MQTGKDFKLSKSTKRVLSTMNVELKQLYKRMMIDAEVCEKEYRKKKLNVKNEGEKE